MFRTEPGSEECDFDLAVRYLRAFLHQLRQSQEPPASPWKKNAHCAGQPNDHNFGSLMMLAVTAGSFLLVVWVATKALFVFLQESPIP